MVKRSWQSAKATLRRGEGLLIGHCERSEKVFAVISWIVFGLIVGALARLVLPGSDPMGWLVTLIVGVVGSVVGGFYWQRDLGCR